MDKFNKLKFERDYLKNYTTDFHEGFANTNIYFYWFIRTIHRDLTKDVAGKLWRK